MGRFHGSLILLYATALVPVCLGVPGYWLFPDNYTGNEAQPNAAPTCLAHPERAYGAHGSPVQNKKITFTISSAEDGPPVSKVCPGANYTVKVDLAKESLAVLTTSQGEFLNEQPKEGSCPGRAVYDFEHGLDAMPKTITNTLAVPCSAEADIQLKVTAAATGYDAYQQAAVNLTVASSCSSKEDTCSGKKNATTPPTPTSPKGSNTSSPALDPVTNLARIASVRDQMCKIAAQKATKCSNSTLGYSCSHAVDGTPKFVIHWSVGGCPPTNPCTETYSLRNEAANASSLQLHMAASYPTTGYVAVSLGRTAGNMPGHDSIIGWVKDGHATVQAYELTGYSLRSISMYPANSSFLVFSGAVEEGGVTTLCFSRPMSFSAARHSAQLSPRSTLKMNWAVGAADQDRLAQHLSNAMGGVEINLASGKLSSKDKGNWIPLHALLMIVAWMYLAPIGIMFARYKEILRERKVCGVHLWFHTHRAVQLTVVVLFSAGITIALMYLGTGQGIIGKLHSWLGKAMIGLLALQLVGAILRPGPDAESRRQWNLFHWNLGRLCEIISTVNVFFGINVWRRETGLSKIEWFIAALVGLIAFALLDIVLWVSSGRGKDNREQFISSTAQPAAAGVRSAAIGPNTV